MRFLKITLAYDGTQFAGWQVQPKMRTVQEVLEQAILKVTGTSIRAVASGRTDAGVHALRQVVSCSTSSTLTVEVLQRALNANTPDDVLVLKVEEAVEGFHAIRDAIGKRYRYVIQDGPLPNLFTRAYSWHVPQHLDQDAMSQAARALIGTHDFKSFEASGAERATSVRTVSDLQVRRTNDGDRTQILFEIAADGFLYNMVRNIVGTLVEIGRGNKPIRWIDQVLGAKDRQLAGMTAPPHGLFLVSVDYGN